MNIGNFLYRLKQKLKYHFSKDDIGKQIAEINRFEKKIEIVNKVYKIRALGLSIPQKKYDYIFLRYDLLIGNSFRLNGHYFIKDDRLGFSWDIYTVIINNAGDLFLINEIFVEKCYQFKLPGNNKINVIDIGMNVGLASLYFASLPYVNEVVGFEPFKKTFELAQYNLSLNPELALKIQANNFGLGDQEKVLNAPFNSENPGLNRSFLEDHENEINVKMESLIIKDALSELNVILNKWSQDYIIIKIDTEGAEYDIMKSIFMQILNERILGFIIEWHKKEPDKLEKLLLKENFKLYNFNLKNNMGIIYAFR